jgi:hypothetical protein
VSVELGTGDVVVVMDRLAARLGPSVRDGVNAAALALTVDARRRYQRAIGPEQRLSGYRYNPKGSKVGDRQGRRVNPYFREATSPTRPQALVAVRGPGHLVEHPRRGGYTIAPRRQGLQVGSTAALAGLIKHGFTDLTAGAAAIGRARNPAVRTPRGPRANAEPGPITRPLRPFLTMVEHAPAIVERAAGAQLQKHVDDVARQTRRIVSKVL